MSNNYVNILIRLVPTIQLSLRVIQFSKEEGIARINAEDLKEAILKELKQ